MAKMLALCLCIGFSALPEVAGHISAIQRAFSLKKSSPQQDDPGLAPSCNMTLQNQVRDSFSLRFRYLKAAGGAQASKLGSLHEDLMGEKRPEKLPGDSSGDDYESIIANLKELHNGLELRNVDIKKLLTLTEAAVDRKRTELKKLQEASGCEVPKCQC
eukprot:TRINITY_DN12444_c1_g1_i1.p1 TRINITY_DN12444_c1_g1~~TRINITY_DN12444_c1_g1_i1.p1  ORF type:complete len:159 (+),score=44.75 TRINITY_DN12444_c1_g1_i1:184-660(+)